MIGRKGKLTTEGFAFILEDPHYVMRMQTIIAFFCVLQGAIVQIAAGLNKLVVDG